MDSSSGGNSRSIVLPHPVLPEFGISISIRTYGATISLDNDQPDLLSN